VTGLSKSLFVQEKVARAVDNSCSVVLDLHQKVDGLEEAELGDSKVGTTGKGVGPCYSTKASRSGIRIADIFQEILFEDKVRKLA
jgi:adenylosuccinate synthase